MKILHVVNISFVLPYYIGRQFDYFQEKGIQYFVACTPSDHLYKYAEEKKITPIPINILREINVIEDLKAIRYLIKRIKSEKFDIVVCHTPKGALIGLIASYLAGVKKRVYFRHGIMYETTRGLKRLILKTIERLSGSLATQVVCVSESILQISQKEGLSSDKKNILLNKGTCNGIDTNDTFNPTRFSLEQRKDIKAKLGIGNDSKVLGFVGRLVNDKGIEQLIDAWKLIQIQMPDAYLLLIGPFEKRDAISPEVRKYIQDEPTIINTGLISDIAPYYSIMDVLVLPSHREGFPTVILEASAMELPVLTTRATGCIDSIIDNKTGRFISIEKHDIANHVLKYFNNVDLARSHGLNGRKWVVQNFQQRVIWEEIEKKIINN